MGYIVRRLLISVLTLIVVFSITFFIMHLIPGGPFAGEKNLPPVIKHNLEVKFGLDKPLVTQYFVYFKNVFTKFDFGMSTSQQGVDVNEIIKTYFPVSMRLGLVAILLALVVGNIFGIISSLKNGKAVDRTIMVIATIGTSVPSFVIATVLLILFGPTWNLLPTYGLDTWQCYILPAVSLSFFPLSFISRLTRSTMLDVLSMDYIKTARAKGLKEPRVIFKHALRNAILPTVTYLGPLLAQLLTGSLIVEHIFTIPGLGDFFVKSIQNRDYAVILGTTIFYGGFLIIMNFIVDVLYVFIDPRIKLKN